MHRDGHVVAQMNESRQSTPEKDEQQQHSVPVVWRGTLRDIVGRLAAGDYGLTKSVDGVAPVSAATAEQMRQYVADYGTTLVELPEDSWTTSVAQWYGSHWDVLVDLWTAEEGRSDLVLFCNVRENGAGYLVALESIHVP
jgi:hypothetical protein